MNTFVGVRESPSVIAPSLLKNLPIGAISLAAPTPGSSWAQTKLPSFACGGRSGAKSRFRAHFPQGDYCYDQSLAVRGQAVGFISCTNPAAARIFGSAKRGPMI